MTFDPTGLSDVRAKVEKETTRRWVRTAREVKRAIVQDDVLGLGPKAPRAAIPIADKAAMFNRWLDEQLMVGVVGNDAAWLKPYIDAASTRAMGRTSAMRDSADEPRDDHGRWSSESATVNFGTDKSPSFHDVPIVRNPTHAGLARFVAAAVRERGENGEPNSEAQVDLRILKTDSGDHVVWNAYHATHDAMAKALDLKAGWYGVSLKHASMFTAAEARAKGFDVGKLYNRSTDTADQANLGFMVQGTARSAKVCHAASVSALAGICDDVSQRALSHVSSGLLLAKRPTQIARLLDQAFGRGLKRTRMLAEHALTQAYSQGTLDALEDAGVTHVGTMTERRVMGDAAEEAAREQAAGIMFTTPEGLGLFVHRTDGDGWAFPGGGVDHPETLENGAVREAQEELGGCPPGVLEPVFWSDKHGASYTTFQQRVANAFAPSALNHEHDAYTWAPLSDPPQPLHPGVAEALTTNGLMDFDANEPRDKTGKWTTSSSGPGGAYLVPTLRHGGTSYTPRAGEDFSHHGAFASIDEGKQEAVANGLLSGETEIGYTTPDQGFLDRFKARKYAEENGLLAPSAYNQRDLISEQVEPAAGDPAHLAFQRASAMLQSGLTAVSPSTTDTDFGGALEGLHGAAHAKFAEASAEIDKGLGLQATDVGVIGAWKDGAENSLVTNVTHADWDKLTTSAAMKAHLSNQKAALVFMQGEDGDSALYSFHAKGDLASIHSGLLEDGVSFHSIAPDADGGGANVYVTDLDGSAFKGVAKSAARFNAKVDYQLGRAAFIGSDGSEGDEKAQRGAARSAYEGIIGKSGVPGAADLWKRVHSSYGQAGVKDALAFDAQSIVEAFFDAAALFDAGSDDEPRDEHGRWTAGPGGGLLGSVHHDATIGSIKAIAKASKYNEAKIGVRIGSQRIDAGSGDNFEHFDLSEEEGPRVNGFVKFEPETGKYGYVLRDPHPIAARLQSHGIEDWSARFPGEVGDAARQSKQARHPRSGKFVTATVGAREGRRSKRSGQFRRQGLTPEEQRREELREARFGRISGKLDVVTAGDDKVCPTCDAISQNGPYTINQARGLIPAHSHCRCLFAAAGTVDLGDWGWHSDEPRDEKGEWTSGGSFTAYHGSSHEFSKFDSSKIGTGQGAQADGYGLYLAREPEVADTYRTEGQGADRSASNLYTVQVHANPDSFLDLDKAIASQGRIGAAAKSLLPDDERDNPHTGRTAYEAIARGRSDKAASDDLVASGVAGLKYLDAGSRAAGKGTHNYVVFDPSKLEVTHRNGKAVSAKDAAAVLDGWLADYDANEPRDDHGQWASGGGGGGSGAAQALIAKATPHQAELVGLASKISTEVDHGTVVRDPGVKSLKSLTEKLSRRAGPDAITDAVRLGFELHGGPEVADDIIKRLSTESGLKVTDEGWRATEAGYVDRTAKLKFPDGMVGEAQIWPPGMYESKQIGHLDYEQARKLDKSDPRVLPLIRKMQARYGAVRQAFPEGWGAFK